MLFTKKALFFSFATFCVLGFALGAKAESGVELLSKKHEVMDQIAKRNLSTFVTNLEHFALSAGLTLDAFVEKEAKAVASATCVSGIVEIFEENFLGIAICIAAIAVYLVTGAIATGLRLFGVKSLAKKDAEPYLEIEHFGNQVRYDRVGVAYEELAKRDNALVIDLPAKFDVKNVRIYTNYIGDASFNTISYSDEFGTHYGIENHNNIANYFNNMEESGLHRRSGGSSVHFTVGNTYDVSSDDQDVAKSAEKDGASISSLADYFTDVKSHYCLSVSKDDKPLINGEFFIDSQGDLSSQCTTQSNYS